MQAGLRFASALIRLCEWAARLAAVVMVVLVFIIMYDSTFRIERSDG